MAWITFEEANKRLGKNLIPKIAGCSVKREGGRIYIDLESDRGDTANHVMWELQQRIKKDAGER